MKKIVTQQPLARPSGKAVRVVRQEPGLSDLSEAVVLASRSEVKRGDWDCFRQAPFVTRLMGSFAYKLALVAAGLADATWTLTPKDEWDIAAGVALVECGGGLARKIDNSLIRFNQKSTRVPGLLACGPAFCQFMTEVALTSGLSSQGRLDFICRQS